MSEAWRIVPLADATPPAPTTKARARRWWGEVLARWRGAAPEAEDRSPAEDRLEALDEARRARFVPDPPVAAQRVALARWRDGRVRGLMLRPDDGSWDAALDDAGEDGPDVLMPPADARLGASLPDHVVARLRAPEPVHVARLEGWWVRHHDGLAALRALLAALAARRDPWTADVVPYAWTWMHAVLPEARGVPAPVRPAPLDGPALRAWLADAATLRLRDSGAAPEDRTYTALAARARGEAGVAAAIWTTAMRRGMERVRDSDEVQVWLHDPATVELPAAASLPHEDLLLIHAVLLQGVASDATVARAAGRDVRETEIGLHVLDEHGLVARDGTGRVRVAPAALPALWPRLAAEAIREARP